MKIEIRNIHYYERMSEETNCFTATVYVDGKKRGEVSNHGTGGPDEFSFDTKDLEAYCATLPRYKSQWAEESMAMDLELVIGDLFDAWLKAKEFKRLTKNGLKTVFKLKEDAEGSFRTLAVPFGPEIKARMVAKYGDRIDYFLNERTSL